MNKLNLIRILLSSLLFLMMLVPVLQSQSFSSSTVGIQVVPNDQVNPLGTTPPTVILPTSGSSATFNLYLFNSRDTQAIIPVYVDSSLYETVTLSPYSYTDVKIPLNVGLHKVQADGETVYVNVTQVSSAVSGTIYINGSPTVFEFKAQPGHVYTLNYSLSSQLSTLETISPLTFISDLANNFFETAYIYPQPADKIALIVPKDIPQGIYYVYIFGLFGTFVNGTEIPTTYVYGLIIVNVSYGIPSSLPSPISYTENGVTVNLENISGFTYLQIQYPFSFENSYTITVYTPTGTQQFTLTNTSGGTYTILGQTYSPQVYGTNVEWAYTNTSVTLKLPQFYKAEITITSPTGSVQVTVPTTSPPIPIVTLNVKVLSTTGLPIQGATVTVYNVSNSQMINTLTTNSNGLTSITLPQGAEVRLVVSANGYFTNSTEITLTSNTTVTIYLEPITVSVQLVQMAVNGSAVSPTQVSTNVYKYSTVSGSTVNLGFKVTVSGMVFNNVTVYALINGVRVSVSGSNGVYELSRVYTSIGVYNVTFVAEYEGVMSSVTLLLNVTQPVIPPPPPPPPTNTTSTNTITTSSSTSTTTSTSSVSTVTPVPLTSSTPSLPLTTILIIVIIVVIAAVAAVILLRR
ncbi:carboxypeptidase-like regulatory domain-containing protein [Sulfolobaceae archaeon RB850M]